MTLLEMYYYTVLGKLNSYRVVDNYILLLGPLFCKFLHYSCKINMLGAFKQICIF